MSKMLLITVCMWYNIVGMVTFGGHNCANSVSVVSVHKRCSLANDNCPHMAASVS